MTRLELALCLMAWRLQQHQRIADALERAKRRQKIRESVRGLPKAG